MVYAGDSSTICCLHEYASCDVGLTYQPAQYNHNVIVHKVRNKFDNEQKIGLCNIIPKLGDIECDLGYVRKTPNMS